MAKYVLTLIYLSLSLLFPTLQTEGGTAYGGQALQYLYCVTGPKNTSKRSVSE